MGDFPCILLLSTSQASGAKATLSRQWEWITFPTCAVTVSGWVTPVETENTTHKMCRFKIAMGGKERSDKG